LETLLELLLGDAVQPAVVLHELPGGHPVVDACVARHEPDLAPDVACLGRDVVPGHGCPPGSWPEHRAENSQAGRLAGSVGAQESEEFAGIEVKSRELERSQVPSFQVDKALGQAIYG